ncbi:MAG: hypothetical protein SFU98_22490 [Leptospiraceae bacterium]|nr:hypothetical protein [Leptospiraceae bacterium]
MKKVFILLLLSFIDSIYSENLKIIFSTGLSGNVNSCLCAIVPIGGLLKRGKFIEDLKIDSKKSILIEAGDFIGNAVPKDKFQAIYEGLNSLNYSIVTLGKNELTNLSINEINKIPNLVIGNINLKDNSIPKYKLILNDKIKIGFTTIYTNEVFPNLTEISLDSPKPIFETNEKIDFWVIQFYGKKENLKNYSKLIPKKRIILLSGDTNLDSKNSVINLAELGKVYANSGGNGDILYFIEIDTNSFQVKSFQQKRIDTDKVGDSKSIQKIIDKFEIK